MPRGTPAGKAESEADWVEEKQKYEFGDTCQLSVKGMGGDRGTLKHTCSIYKRDESYVQLGRSSR